MHFPRMEHALLRLIAMPEDRHVASAACPAWLRHRTERKAVGRERAHAETRHAALVKRHVALDLDAVRGHDAKPFQTIDGHARPRPLVRNRADQRIARLLEHDAELLHLGSIEFGKPIRHRGTSLLSNSCQARPRASRGIASMIS